MEAGTGRQYLRTFIGLYSTTVTYLAISKAIGFGHLDEQVAQLSQRDHAAGWIRNGEKWKTGAERNIGLYSTTATYLASKEIEIGEKMQKKVKVIQGHPRASRSVPIESPYATSY